ncbi:hypothetical protein ANN_14017 [Periplaneta americana]|uniref:Uncharacterized protein n=1 Tax=Periplaneta americana TaxID=6978 RepID=A0ABQ8SWC2_PERAM|nr:hypothetical protein ANN_14017 [Periplaneta americana]
MVDRLGSEVLLTVNSEANARRIAMVESCFGSSGQPLGVPGRVLVGEGVLTKMCRKKPKARQFFLFNDILVYGNIVINKKKRNSVTKASDNGLGDHRANHTIPPFWLDDRPPLLRHVDVRPAAGWLIMVLHGLSCLRLYSIITESEKGRCEYNKQHIIPLEEVKLESLEDDGQFRNGWLIRTASKSFAVYAATSTEKQEWMAHINKCIEDLLRKSGKKAVEVHAAVWVPDSEAAVCMHCKKTQFTVLNRRHHCRKCGAVVCGPCSNKRFLLPSQSSKPLRVCLNCYDTLSRARVQQNNMGNPADNSLHKDGKERSGSGDSSGEEDSDEEDEANRSHQDSSAHDESSWDCGEQSPTEWRPLRATVS